ncbi:formate dehydrogenase accessory protein FdhE [Pseudothauera rhizosphaerae]|uniref:Formate dehydrogenase accessory protein FdhE n=1 Tax=Pseudothauera rhizosphaerae TaxID=2565932 RepID=A0A4S4AZM6_9RHOO|nr:formate dehydrogenase accessory protein FdhE [Pseudothauera rhizosphaerae]THF65219.1 formate dehydrogenase accessory protein FdhE [Pseudothauera rhizosphaerae]
MLAEQTLPSRIAPPLLLAPPADLFIRRAARLRHLAAGHALAPWLGWLAELCTAQQQVLDQLSVAAGAAPAALREAVPAAYAALLSATPDAPPALAPEALGRRIERNLLLAAGEAVAAGRDLDDLVVAAAMQAVWTAAARRAGEPAANPSNAESCPHCGSAAVGSIVLAGDGKEGLRYQECCLCATRWNVVRARCTLCADGAVVDYLSLDGGNGAIAAETCDHCHGYAKICFAAKDRDADPFADDLATLALDVLVGEQGHARAAPNLFLCEGEVVARD